MRNGFSMKTLENKGFWLAGLFSCQFPVSDSRRKQNKSVLFAMARQAPRRFAQALP